MASESNSAPHKLVLNPYLGLSNAIDFAEFAKKVFNAQDKERKLFADGKQVMHGIVNISGTDVMYSDATKDKGYMNSGLMVYVENCDETYKKALAEGAVSVMEPSDQHYGRSSGAKDPFGTTWWITSVEKKDEDSEGGPTSTINNINIPANYQGVMPYLMLKDAPKFSEFVQKVFDAKETINKKREDGTSIMHAEVSVAGYTIMFSEGLEEWGGASPGAIGITGDNTDEYYNKALEAGGTSTMEPAEYPWGRFCGFKDTCGNTWWLNSPPKSGKRPAPEEGKVTGEDLEAKEPDAEKKVKTDA